MRLIYRLNSKYPIPMLSGQNENTLTLTDKEGKILSDYLKKEIPFIMFRPVQFIACGSDYLFQLGISNTYVAFNPETETFKEGIFTQDQSYLSKEQLLESFKINGMDFIRKANQGSYMLSTISVADSDNSVLLYANPEQLSEYGNDLLDKFGNKINCHAEDNPCIIEFF